MGFLNDLLKKPPALDDIVYFARAVVTRPGDIPGILRREASRRRAGHGKPPPPDPLGLRCLTESWEAAEAAGVLTAPPGTGAPLALEAPLDTPLAWIAPLQHASAVEFRNLEEEPLFPALSLEAARLGLSQRATDPPRAAAARAAFVEDWELSDNLRRAFRRLAAEPIGPL